ncbi:MAG: hypothetical protein U1F54_21240 [Burkholderiales bacterium]
MLEALAQWLVGQPIHVLAVAGFHFALWALVGLATGRWAATRNLLWVPTMLWLVYAAWEAWVQAATPDANIRVDLLLIWPLIALVTAWSAWRTAIAPRTHRDRSSDRG